MNNEEPKLSTMIILALFSLSAALCIDYTHRGRDCGNQGLWGSAFFACVKSISCSLWMQPRADSNVGKPTCTAQLNHFWGSVIVLLIPLASFFTNEAPNDVQVFVIWRQSCDTWGMKELEGMEKPAPSTAGAVKSFLSWVSKSTYFTLLWASLPWLTWVSLFHYIQVGWGLE